MNGWWLALAVACGERPDPVGDAPAEGTETSAPAVATGCAAPGVVCTALGLPGLSLNNGNEGEAHAFGLHLPTGVVVGKAGEVYVADESNHRIVALHPDGTAELVAGTGYVGDTPEGSLVAAPLHGPSAVYFEDVGTRGRLLVATRGTARVVRVDLDARTVAHVAGTGVRGYSGEVAADLAQLSLPRGVTAGPDGAIYIADTGNHLVRTLAADGRLVNLAGQQGVDRHGGDGGPARDATLHGPVGLAVADGTLYVADSGSHTIRRIDLAAGTISTLAGRPGQSGHADGTPGTFTFPTGLALDGAGGLLVVEEGSHCLRRVALDTGAVERFAGVCGEPGFGGDLGPRLDALIQAPMGAAVGPDGTVWLADTGNQVIRTIRP
jgi:sugar lactone lactonase YvrE